MILAEKSESIKKAVLKLHELTGEEKVRLQCEARENKAEEQVKKLQELLKKNGVSLKE